jgi:uncharacterized protein (DUF427 family)
VCPWKGTASYYDVVDNEINRGAAWYYPTPSPRAAGLVGGRIGFWRGVKIEQDADDGRVRRSAKRAGGNRVCS